MAKVDRVARWIAGYILAEQGRARTPARMADLMPLAYLLADATLGAVREFSGEIAADSAVMDMTEFEAQFSEHPGSE